MPVVRELRVLLVVVTLSARGPTLAADLGTTITYQGRLVKNGTPIGSPAPVNCNMTFRMWDDDTGGSEVGSSPVGPTSIQVSDGLFDAQLDFGDSAIDGTARWLEITVQCPGDISATTLTPRTELTPAPHALALPGLYTQQNQFSPNIVGGNPENYVAADVVGATISGGGGLSNWFGGNTGYCFGGSSDGAPCGDCYSGSGAFIHENCSDSTCVFSAARCVPDQSECPGGVCIAPYSQVVSANFGTVSGGASNWAGGSYASVNGGFGNDALGSRSVVGGGGLNSAAGSHSFVAGGYSNVASGEYSTVAGGFENYASGLESSVSGGSGNESSGPNATISGGDQNLASGDFATTGGGESNRATGDHSVVGGGQFNEALAYAATVGGGYANDASGSSSMVPGGSQNVAGGSFSFAAGRRARVRTATQVGGGDSDGDEGTFVWADSTDANFTSTGPNQFLIRSSGGVGIGTNAPTDPLTVAGVIRSSSGGFELPDGTIIDAAADLSSHTHSSLAASDGNPADAVFVDAVGSVGIGTASPAAELHVRAADDICELRMSPDASEQDSQIYLAETPGGSYATILRHDGAGNIFRIRGVNAGTESGDYLTIARSSGRVGIGRTSSANALEVEGNASKTAAGSWLANSDASIKDNVSPLANALEVIDRLRPVAFQYTPSYREEHPSIDGKTYYNFIAQEFGEVFPEWVHDSGEDGLLQMDSYPASVYSVAAIQELHNVVMEKDCEIRELREEIDRQVGELKERNSELEARLKRLEAILAPGSDRKGEQQ